MGRLVIVLAAVLAAPVAAIGQPAPKGAGPSDTPRSLQVQLNDSAGAAVGNVQLDETPHGVLMKVTITNLPAGVRAFHIHAIGRCSPTFEAAGDHFNPTRKEHGFSNPKGQHGGDLPNLHIPDSGQLVVEMLARDVTLRPGRANSLLDADGSALVVHAKADDYRSDPAGESGDRIACGALTRGGR